MTTRAATRVLMAMAMCVVAASPAAGQTGAKPQAAASSTPSMDIYGGYAYLREQGVNGSPANIYDTGWVVAVGQRVGMLRVVGEAGGSYLPDSLGGHQALYGFLGGVRIGLIHISRFKVFGQALVGVERFTSPGFSESNFAFQPGAGIDLPLVGKISLRVQGDYRLAPSTVEATTFKEARVTAGVVIGIR